MISVNKILKNTEELPNNLEFLLMFPIDLSKSFKEAKKLFLKNYVNDLLTMNHGNISQAAKKACINRRHLHRIITENEIVRRKDMIKPSEYRKENIQTILEETLSGSQNMKTVEDISELIAKTTEKSVAYDEAIELFEKEYIEHALKSNDYDISRTADAIDVSERTLYRKINKLSIARNVTIS
jgi:DNA-binding NtrC family response regulator